MSEPTLIRSTLPGVAIHDCRETFFFSHEDGRLCQWLEVDLTCKLYPPTLSFEIVSGRLRTSQTFALFKFDRNRRITVRLHAPALWPKGPDRNARLRVSGPDGSLEARITIGSHRPWTIYLLSDLCADDTWAYENLARHDRDDYLTTLAELNAGPDNRYNLAACYQAERFDRQAKPAERRQFGRAVKNRQLYVTPMPNQFSCGLFNLAAYPLVLEPFRRFCTRAGLAPHEWTSDAYHMEATTWTGGLVKLLAAAGFRSFGKSLLEYQAPWIEHLRTLPRLTRLEASPGRFVYLLLRCGDYAEGGPALAGLPQANEFLHACKIPEHLALGDEYPISAIPLVGSYGDLAPASKHLAAVKTDAIRRYNSQGWAFPRLVNATWEEFFDHVEGELGPPHRAARRLRTVRGGIGASWEVWALAAQAEAARFRTAQRDVNSVRTLAAMLQARPAPQTLRRIERMTMELVALGDHAWNGSSEKSKALNLSIRRRRLKIVEAEVAAVRKQFRKGDELSSGRRFAVVNTLGWTRICRVELPSKLFGRALALRDVQTGKSFPVRSIRRAGQPLRVHADIADVPAFGARKLELCAAAEGPPANLRPCPLPITLQAMKPALQIDGRERTARGGWKSDEQGKWRIGPFTIHAAIESAGDKDGAAELHLSVTGVPPKKAYDLRWGFQLPWKRCQWRGEMGGDFVTPGPAGAGGDNLLGVAGSIFSAGEGLSAGAGGGKRRIDFAFGESGMCGLGGLTTQLAKGSYNEKPPADLLRRSAMRSVLTPGRLEWYLLANAQNLREAFTDQGAARSWRFSCALRGRDARFDDADLYRFAAGFNRPGEIVRMQAARNLDAPPWAVKAPRSVLVLGAVRRKDRLEIDLFNTSGRTQTVRLGGAAISGRTIAKADMLGRITETFDRPSIRLEPKTFGRIVIQ